MPNGLTAEVQIQFLYALKIYTTFAAPTFMELIIIDSIMCNLLHRTSSTCHEIWKVRPDIIYEYNSTSTKQIFTNLAFPRQIP